MIDIVKTKQKYARSFCEALDIVARERKYLKFVTGFPIDVTREFVRNAESENFAQFFVVENENVIGWCDIISNNHEGYVHVGNLGIGILMQYRKKGIGSKLLEKTLAYAKDENHIEKVELEVFETNEAAISLYKKFGFIEEGRKTKARKLAGKYEDILLMAKEI